MKKDNCEVYYVPKYNKILKITHFNKKDLNFSKKLVVASFCVIETSKTYRYENQIKLLSSTEQKHSLVVINSMLLIPAHIFRYKKLIIRKIFLASGLLQRLASLFV